MIVITEKYKGMEGWYVIGHLINVYDRDNKKLNDYEIESNITYINDGITKKILYFNGIVWEPICYVDKDVDTTVSNFWYMFEFPDQDVYVYRDDIPVGYKPFLDLKKYTTKEAMANIREWRNRRLAASDYIMTTDWYYAKPTAFYNKWAIYRQKLREIPQTLAEDPSKFYCGDYPRPSEKEEVKT